MQIRVIEINSVKYGRFPKSWCEENGIMKGDLLHFIETADGSLVIFPRKVDSNGE